jgi:hypothetical protein
MVRLREVFWIWIEMGVMARTVDLLEDGI